MFEQRSAALLDGDTDAFLARLSEAARQTEWTIVDGARKVPLSSAKLTLAPETQPGSETTLTAAEVLLTYQYEGLPADNLFRVQLSYDLARREKGWEVTNSQFAEGARLPIWITGPVQTARSPHFLALFRPGLLNAQASLQLAESARNDLSPKLTLPLEEAHLILIARDRTEYLEFSGRQSPETAIANFESTYSISPSSITTESRQIIVNLSQMSGRQDSIDTFVHELGHLALSPQTRPFTPAWITESSAMFLAGTRPTAAWRQGVRTGRFARLSFLDLSRATTLGAHDPTGEAGSFEYAYASAAGHYLIETFGPESFWRLYSAFAEVPPETVYGQISNADRQTAIANLAADTTRAALTRIYGFDEKELDRRVRGWIAREIS